MSRLPDILFPRVECLICSSPKAVSQGICADCRLFLHTLRLGEAHCPHCGLPGIAYLCPECISSPPAYDSALGAYRYKGCVRTLIARMKFQGEPRLSAKAFLPTMQDLAKAHFPDADLILPVPLSRAHMAKRGYNQSAYLARPLAAALRIAMREDMLWRVRNTLRQSDLPKAERERNMEDAFAASLSVRGHHVLLIDDVLTTGHTVSSCAKTLKAAGAASVCVLTAARAALD